MFIGLVAEKYIPNPENKEQVNHINDNKLGNRVKNLEWVTTNQENRNQAVKNGLHAEGEACLWAKLTEQDVIYIKQHPDINSSVLAESFGVSRRTISDIKENKT